MSKDVKKNKLLKKITGILGYKIFNKNFIKSERILNSNTLKIDEILNNICVNNNFKKIIQLGANDGISDDFMFSIIKKNNISAILLEPLNENFIKLKKNYSDYKNITILKKAVDIKDGKRKIYKINNDYYDYYKKKYNTENGDWINVLASFDKKHLLEHGIKMSHISEEEVESISIKNVIEKNNFQDFNLLVSDIEGYDYEIIIELLSHTNYRPCIVFEWVHMNERKIFEVCEILKKENYSLIKINKDLVCINKNNIKLNF